MKNEMLVCLVTVEVPDVCISSRTRKEANLVLPSVKFYLDTKNFKPNIGLVAPDPCERRNAEGRR